MHLLFAALLTARSTPRTGSAARRARRLVLSAGTVTTLAAVLAAPLAAQQRDTTRAAPPAGAVDTGRAPAPRRPARRAATPTTALPDSLTKPPISPRRAFAYSFVIPGLGQHRLRRPIAEALFTSVELGAWFMVAKSQNDLRVAKNADSLITGYGPPVPPSTDSVPITQPNPLTARIKARRLHVEDWIAVVIFNHIFAGADAFVAANLWDLPAQVSFRPMPRGVALNASIAW